MDSPQTAKELDAIIPGAVKAYESLRADNGMGIYTSNGTLFNHTLFGRDASATAKFASSLDHAAAHETIIALAALQGRKDNPKTHEEPGRIHHELRYFSTWKGSWAERQIFRFIRSKWGASDDRLLTYFANDSTASYIRLVNKYVHQVDRSILDTSLVTVHDDRITVGESVAEAAKWIVSRIDERGHFIQLRRNKWALPFQTYMDSVTAFARTDGHIANFKQPMSYIETHMYAADALEDATKILSSHEERHIWQDAAHKLRDSFMRDFWVEDDNYFAPAIDIRGRLDMRMITAGWTLNTSLWDEIPAEIRTERIKGIINMLFSDEFLTSVGLRTRSISQRQPMKDVIEYHNSHTVWPMFTFMVIEGLHRHGFHQLALQLENRLINGLNAFEGFNEFFIVDRDGSILCDRTGNEKPQRHVKVQMVPEKYIAFTVVPSVVLAHRARYGYQLGTPPDDWRKDFEESILERIEIIDRAEPGDARSAVGTIIPTDFHRWRGNITTAIYFLKEMRRLK